MVFAKIASLLKSADKETAKTDDFLRKISGVVHVGANSGQEREHYNHLGLEVLWIEPIPEVYESLLENIRDYPKQKAIKALITDTNDMEYQFNIASNNGASSSIFELDQHKKLWPHVKYTDSITLRSTTLTSLFKTHNVNLNRYQALVMDTQGSELLVLKGALPLLIQFRYIKTEVPDFEAYKNCCQLHEIEGFMSENNFSEISRKHFAGNEVDGNYFDIVYQQNKAK